MERPPSTPTTLSDEQFHFKKLASKTANLSGVVSIQEMMDASKKAPNNWGGPEYLVPRSYLRKRVPDKDDDKKSRFVESAGDGPAYSLCKAKRGRFFHLNEYGKEGKEPPHSYLPYREWSGKKEAKKEEEKGEKKGVTGRGTFIDAIFFEGKKYQSPAPNAYFSAGKKEKKEPRKEEEKKAFFRLNFLCDAEYLGMNCPCPGTYSHRDPWIVKSKKMSEEEKKKHVYTPGGWRLKNDRKQGPGEYEVVRFLTLSARKDESDKGKSSGFVVVPTMKRTRLGVINKTHDTKRTVDAVPTKAAPGSYFKSIEDEAKTFRSIVSRPMRKF